MSSVAIASFKWLDTLEKEFDKSFVDVDLFLNNLYIESENGDLGDDSVADFIDAIRERVKVMSQSWAQLVHKSQTIFQSNCKLEVTTFKRFLFLFFYFKLLKQAQIVNLTSDLVEAKGFKIAAERELEKLMLELHTLQLQHQKLKELAAQQYVNLTPANSSDPASTTDLIQKKIEEEMEKRFSSENLALQMAKLQCELDQVKKENDQLKEQTVNLNSEIYGARLAAKYLDKELTGRIQQIQLFGKNLKPEEHERLWNQLEAEIHLHRHKTIVKACRAKNIAKKQKDLVNSDPANSDTLSQGANGSVNGEEHHATSSPMASINRDLDELRKADQLNKIRVVKLNRKNNKEGLGISITGGAEHGLPILISEIHTDGPAARSGSLYVGDAILAANGHELKDVSHAEAVSILTNLVIFLFNLTRTFNKSCIMCLNSTVM